MNIQHILAVAVLTATTGTVLAATPASAGTEVITTGACSGSADWKMKAKARDGRIEFEGEIDSNHSGQVWRWKIKHNGTVSATGRSTTAGRSGSFSINRRMVDLAGTDHFVLRAVDTSSGQVCRGSLDF